MSSTMRLGTCRNEKQYRSTMARPMRSRARMSAMFSNREIVGCEARSRPEGAIPCAILNTGSERRLVASFPSHSQPRSACGGICRKPNG